MKNSQGKIFYGLHFYPGVAEYQEPDQEPYRVFLNEDTLRKMDPTFSARPIFVEHVDEVEENLDELRKEADGWVVESFFNAADGKHWVKFIVTSERGEKAISQGMRLSNAYIPKQFGEGGLWNGVSYAKEITDGEYEHLAIVRNPRYEESVIMTPEEFKKYNEAKLVELKRLSNSKEQKGEGKMAFKLFKRTKVENSADLEGMSVVLPKSGKEMTITELVEAHDKVMNMQGYASGDHMVKVGENEMSVNDLVKAHMSACNEIEEMKKKNAEGEDGDMDADDSMDNDEEGKKKLEADDSEKEVEEAKKKNELEEATKVKKEAAKKKADALRNAQEQALVEVAPLEFSVDQVARGKSRYGSK